MNLKLLSFNQQNKTDDMREKQTLESIKFYDLTRLFKEKLNFFLNLYDIIIEEDIMRIISLGMNFQVEGSFKDKKRNVEVELFYEKIRGKDRSTELNIT